MKRKRLTLLASVLAMMLLFVGCKKEEVDMTSKNVTVQMLKFKSFKDVMNCIADDNKNSPNGDFVSYGAFMDSAYYGLDAENRFQTLEELKQFVSENNKMYQLILVGEDEYMFETRLYDHPFRNVANKEGLFQVKDSVFKIVEGGLIGTSLCNQGKLQMYDFAQYGLDKEIKTILFDNDSNGSKDQQYNCGKSLCEEHTTGNNKITLKIDISTINLSYLNLENYALINYLAKPYHYSIAWFGCNRTITVSLNSIMDFKIHNTWHHCPHESFYSVVSHTGNKFEKAFTSWSITEYPFLDSHIGATNSYASTYDAGVAHITCNTTLFDLL